MTTPTRPKRPNFLIILTDEERYPVPEETPALRHFRETELIGRRWLQETGTTFHNHYTSATACTPSRACLFTGQYSTIHGVSETFGFAKTAEDPRIQWLEPGTVPTMGNFFRAAGYETLYKGKWHISHADLMDKEGNELATLDEEGRRIREAEEVYLSRQPLDEFGFSDWIGPEPHGSKIENGGIHRDATFSEQVCEYFQQREERLARQRLVRQQQQQQQQHASTTANDGADGDEVKPFLMVASLVNPHDVALFPQFKFMGMELSDPTVPAIPEAPSDSEDLSTKPSPQKKYVEAFENLYCARDVHRELFNSREEMRRMYYYLHKIVDQDIRHIYLALKATSFFNDTIVIFTSDHGDVLGAHGNLLQKWTVAYQEAIHIPLVISAPWLPRGDVDFVTSAVDLLPTMINLAGLDQHALVRELARTHSEAHDLVGNDFSGVLTGRLPRSSQDDNVAYFMTEDEVTKGNSQVSIRGAFEYDHVEGPCSIEAVVCYLTDRVTGERELWKYTRYFDDPRKWSHPFVKDVTITRTGPNKGKVTVRRVRHEDEFELYNLTRDPSELRNLAHPTVLDRLDSATERRQVVDTLVAMASRLEKASRRKKERNTPFPIRVIRPTQTVVSKL